jgi:hypothetical protein
MSEPSYVNVGYPRYPDAEAAVSAGQRRDIEFLKRKSPLGLRPEFFRAYHMRYSGSPLTTAITGVGLTNVAVRWDWWQLSDDTIFEPRAYSGYSDPVVMSTDLVGSVRLLQPGHYTITVGFRFQDDVTDWRFDWTDSDNPWGYDEGNYGGSTQGYNSVGWNVATITRIYPLPEYGSDPPDDYWPATGFVEGSVQVATRNASGSSDNELNYSFLEILYLPVTIPS